MSKQNSDETKAIIPQHPNLFDYLGDFPNTEIPFIDDNEECFDPSTGEIITMETFLDYPCPACSKQTLSYGMWIYFGVCSGCMEEANVPNPG